MDKQLILSSGGSPLLLFELLALLSSTGFDIADEVPWSKCLYVEKQMNLMIINQCAQKQWHIKESLKE